MNIGKTISQNSPSILVGLGITGLVGSVAMTIRSSAAASDSIDQELYRRYLADGGHPETTFEEYQMEVHSWGYTVQNRVDMMLRKDLLPVVLPIFMPVILTTGLSVGAILLGNRLHLKRTAAVVGMYSFAERTLRTYQDKLVETVGERKAETVRAHVDEKEINSNPPNDHNVHNTGGGTDLCYEPITGRYFWSEAAAIRAAFNKFNHDLMQENQKALNELYYELGLPSVDVGRNMGWDSEDGLLEFTLGARIMERGEHPCLVISYDTLPKPLWENN